MYTQGYIASLKVGGKILRESNGTVSLPFGSEYSVLLKNKLSRRAQVKVEVDGQDATEGTKLILPANGSLELERFIKSGNLKAGNKFKFIERTSKIEEHRGIKEDDGLIRIEFWAEKEVVDVPVVRHHYYDDWVPVRRYYWDRPWYDPYYPTWPQPTITWNSNSGIQTSCYNTSGSLGEAQSDNLGSAQNFSGSLQKSSARQTRSLHPQASSGITRDSGQQVHAQNCMMAETSFNDAGITVPGSHSNQEFQSTYGFETESNSHVIVLQLRGVVGDKPVVVPVTVDHKPVCPTCGTTNKAQNKFCKECGTALQLV
jgi:hypothetical protein